MPGTCGEGVLRAWKRRAECAPNTSWIAVTIQKWLCGTGGAKLGLLYCWDKAFQVESHALFQVLWALGSVRLPWTYCLLHFGEGMLYECPACCRPYFVSLESCCNTNAFELNQCVLDSLTQPLEGMHLSLHLNHTKSILLVFFLPTSQWSLYLSTGCTVQKGNFLMSVMLPKWKHVPDSWYSFYIL